MSGCLILVSEVRRAVVRRHQLVLIGCALAIAGGGGGDESASQSGSGGDSGQPARLKVGVIPIADVAPLYVGIEQGYFKDEELTIEPQIAEGGAAIATSVMSG